MDTNELRIKLNNYILEKHLDTSLIIYNLEVFYELSNVLKENLLDITDAVSEIDYTKISKMAPFENFELIKKFYKENNIDLEIEKYINNGTIDLRFFDEFNDSTICEEEKKYYFVAGREGTRGKHISLETPNNGFITDSSIMVHELSHLHDDTKEYETWTRSLLTEPLAFAEQFIYLDYLEELGYVDESRIIKAIDYVSAYHFSRMTNKLYKILITFDTFSDLEQESYKKLYDDEDYEDGLAILSDILSIEENKISSMTNYVLGYSLGVYMYNEYRKDKNYIKHIQKLHKILNEEDFLICLNEMGLNCLDKNDRDLIEESIQDINKQISNKRIKR